MSLEGAMNGNWLNGWEADGEVGFSLFLSREIEFYINFVGR